MIFLILYTTWFEFITISPYRHPEMILEMIWWTLLVRIWALASKDDCCREKLIIDLLQVPHCSIMILQWQWSTGWGRDTWLQMSVWPPLSLGGCHPSDQWEVSVTKCWPIRGQDTMTTCHCGRWPRAPPPLVSKSHLSHGDKIFLAP